jgi:ribosomal protein S18 acetylase RimI-like enzyme
VTAAGPVIVRATEPDDRTWIESFLADNHSREVARRGELVRPADHPMVIAFQDGEPVGLLTWIEVGAECEILTLHVAERWRGIGTALVEAAADAATERGCHTLWALTTNDNLDALRFYQRRGFRIRTLRPGAVDAARVALKPSIPEVGDHAIPIRDEIELERPLTAATGPDD